MVNLLLILVYYFFMTYKEQILAKIKEIFDNSIFMSKIDIKKFEDLEEYELEKILFIAFNNYSLEKKMSESDIKNVEDWLLEVSLSITNISSNITKSFLYKAEQYEKEDLSKIEQQFDFI